MTKVKLSIVSPCFNEADNIELFYTSLCNSIDPLLMYQFEIIFIDNASSDLTVDFLKKIASKDDRVKIICNIRNFGQVRSPYWGLMQSSGEATILIASDLQDPPDLIPLLIEKWRCGWEVVMAKKTKSHTNFIIHQMRKIYYRALKRISDFDVIEDANGYGLYSHKIISIIKDIQDPYPYLRGLVCEIGFPIATVEYTQRKRLNGKSKSNFYHLYDVAMLGFINNSTLPLRITSIVGFLISICSFIACLFFIVLKILYWENYTLGLATITSSIFFLFGMLFCFLGILGEYIASIFIQVRNRPIVIEKERINFE